MKQGPLQPSSFAEERLRSTSGPCSLLRELGGLQPFLRSMYRTLLPSWLSHQRQCGLARRARAFQTGQDAFLEKELGLREKIDQ